jgi:hypothetical protein
MRPTPDFPPARRQGFIQESQKTLEKINLMMTLYSKVIA